MIKKLIFYNSLILTLFVPTVTFAAGKNLATIIDLIISYVNRALILLLAVAVVIFVWYIIRYFIIPNENRAEAGKYVMYSVIGFFVVLSFWGIVNILQNTFGLQNETNRPASWASFTNLFPGGSSGGNQTAPQSFSPSPFQAQPVELRPGGSQTDPNFDASPFRTQ